MAITLSPKPDPFAVYAYGVAPSQLPPRMDWDGRLTVYSCAGFLHYWIDDHLQYHERECESGAIPELHLVTASHVEVRLRGPRDYTINSKR